MKKITLLILGMVMTAGLTAQNRRDCNAPISNVVFQQKMNAVTAQQNESGRLHVAINIAANNCLSTAQVKELAAVFHNDLNRLDFVKTAYQNTFDKTNFYDVFDEFLYFSTVMRLYDYLHSFDQAPVTPPPVVQPAPVPVPPPCAVSRDDFEQMKKAVEKESFSTTKVNLAKQAIRSGKCFRTGQIIELLGLFSFESAKLEIAKFAFDFTTDRENYFKVAEAFSYDSSKNELLEFIKGR